MDWVLDRASQFFVQNFPSWRAILLGGPPGLLWPLVCLWWAGRLKARGVPTGYTRKVFHFLVFITAAALQWKFGTPAVCLFGAACTAAIFFALWRGSGNVLYEGIAREKDAPRRTFFIVTPYFATLVGGLASNILFGPFALSGYLVTGLGDAIGEPAGTRFGRHPYRVPSLAAVPATRTVEGSVAVFVASCVALSLSLAALPQVTVSVPLAVAVVVGVAAISTLVEAVSPHGWDNATLQLVPSGLVWMLLR